MLFQSRPVARSPVRTEAAAAAWVLRTTVDVSEGIQGETAIKVRGGITILHAPPFYRD